MIILYLIGACVLGFCMDWVYAKYTVYAADGNPFSAANFSFLIYVFGLMYTLMIIDKRFDMVAAYLVGGYAGTFLGVRRKK